MHLNNCLETTTVPIRWLRVPGAVAYSGLSRSLLYRLMAEGRIKSICVRNKGNIRGARVLSVDSIDAFLESCTEEEVIA